MKPVHDSPESLLQDRPLLTTQRRRTLRLAAPLLLAAAFAWIAHAGGLETFERISLDARFRWRGPIAPDRRIVVVEIDEAARRRLGEGNESRFDIRRWLSGAIERLADAGVVAIGVDIRLEGRGDADTDAALAKAIRETNTVLAVAYTQGYAVRAADVLRGDDAHEGLIAIQPDSDGVVRRLPDYPNLDLFAGGQSVRRIPHFAFALAHLLLADEAQRQGRPIPPLNLDAADHTTFAGRFFSYRRPVQWVAARGQGFATLRFDDVLRGQFDPKKADGAVAIIGDVRSLLDQFRFPMADGLQPGVYYHANVINEILSGRQLRIWPAGAAGRSWLAAAITLIAGAAFWNLREWWRLPHGYLSLAIVFAAGFVVLLGGWWLACLHAFRAEIVLPMAAPMAAIAATAATGLAGQLAVSVAGARRLAARNRMIESIFERHVSAEVLAAIKERPDAVAATEVRDVSVVFCDIRGFTAAATRMQPQQVASMLNEYFEHIGSAVLEHGGFIDKFVGDELMAVFGAPLEQADHVERSARAAVAIQARVAELTRRRAERGEAPLQCGVGIHCGPAAAGLIGTASRANYTVVGDTVNVASRIQELAEHNEILASEDVARRLPPELAAKPWRQLTLRGHADAQTIFEIGPAEMS